MCLQGKEVEHLGHLNENLMYSTFGHQIIGAKYVAKNEVDRFKIRHIVSVENIIKILNLNY